MIKLNVNEEKQLNFAVQIGGVNHDQIVSHLRITLEGIEYGFPATVINDAIIVDLPALNKIVAKKLKEGDEASVKLEMIADNHYLVPWRDTAVFSNPLVVEAKIVGDTVVSNPSIKTRLVTENKSSQKEDVKEKDEPQEELTEDLVNRLALKLSKMVKEQTLPEKEKAKQEDSEEILEDAEEVVKKAQSQTSSLPPSPMKESGARKTKPQQKKLSEHDEESRMKDMVYNTLRKLHAKESLTESKSATPKSTSVRTPAKKEKINIQEIKERLTKQDILNYMTKKGAKNTKVQEVIFNKASEKAKSPELFDVLQEVAKILNSKKNS